MRMVWAILLVLMKKKMESGKEIVSQLYDSGDIAVKKANCMKIAFMRKVYKVFLDEKANSWTVYVA